MKGNYNTIAPYYDILSRLVFGNAVVEAQKQLIPFITANSKVLIVGGGTGWLLEEIATLHQGLDITYLECSEKMLVISKTRNWGQNQVGFVHDTIQDAVLQKEYEIVITPFVLDNFSDTTAALVFDKIDQLLIPEGLWLFSDFEAKPNARFWQSGLLKLMYVFFRVTCNIEARSLPDLPYLFKKHQYKISFSKIFFSGFIRSVVYTKSKTENAVSEE